MAYGNSNTDKTAPPAQVQNLGQYLPRVQGLPEERTKIQNDRELVERIREHNRLEGERALAEGIEHKLPIDIFGNVTSDPDKVVPHWGYPPEVLQVSMASDAALWLLLR